MNTESLARALGGHRVGSQWMARCPAHDDRNPSLSISNKAGKLLVHCHAGCSQNDVMDELKVRGLLKAPSVSRDRNAQIVAEYDYTDRVGKLLYQVVRFRPKGFAQRHSNGDGGWVWRKHPQQVLYHLPEVLEAPIVFVVEGEKDCETLRSHGFVTTTNAGGANAQWLPQYTDALCGREVIVIPDNDRPGWERAARIARALLGAAARIRLLELPPDSKDISDWFTAGHSECELIAMLDGVNAH
jgi:putative DNA primase/helicase